MTHPSRTNAFLGRTLDFANDPLKSLIQQKDSAGIAGVILWQGAPENEGARQERWAFLALNTFDVAVSSLFTPYGSRAPECEWWQRAPISEFEDLAERYPSMKPELLWFRLPWPYSKQSQVERKIDEILSTQTR
jgi:hypothetical protein